MPATPAAPLLPGQVEHVLTAQDLPTSIAPSQLALMTMTKAIDADICPVCEACKNGLCLPEGAQQ